MVCGPARATSTGATDPHPRRLPLHLMNPEERLERYADLVVRIGANVQPGQDVVVMGLVEHVPIVRAIARAAYRAGAGRVEPWYSDLHVRRAAIESGPAERLGESGAWALDRMRDWFVSKPAILQLSGPPDPSLFNGLEPQLVARAEEAELRKAFRPIVLDRVTNWAIVPAPNEGWAQAVFGRARPRAAVGGGRDCDPLRRARSGRSLARTHRRSRRAGGAVD